MIYEGKKGVKISSITKKKQKMRIGYALIALLKKTIIHHLATFPPIIFVDLTGPGRKFQHERARRKNSGLWAECTKQKKKKTSVCTIYI